MSVLHKIKKWFRGLLSKRQQCCEIVSPVHTPQEIKETLAEISPDAILYPDLEGALIGIVRQFSRYLALYDYDKALEILANNFENNDDDDIFYEMDQTPYEAALEWIEYNTLGSWVGDYTPIFIRSCQLTCSEDLSEII